MTTATIRELRNHGGEVVDRAARGETIIITRNGTPVAELRPLPSPRLSREAIIAAFRHLPPIDPRKFREDVNAVIDQSL